MQLYPISELSPLHAQTVELHDFVFEDGNRFNGTAVVDILAANGRGHVYLDLSERSRRLTESEARRLPQACRFLAGSVA